MRSSDDGLPANRAATSSCTLRSSVRRRVIQVASPVCWVKFRRFVLIDQTFPLAAGSANRFGRTLQLFFLAHVGFDRACMAVGHERDSGAVPPERGGIRIAHHLLEVV